MLWYFGIVNEELRTVHSEGSNLGGFLLILLPRPRLDPMELDSATGDSVAAPSLGSALATALREELPVIPVPRGRPFNRGRLRRVVSGRMLLVSSAAQVDLPPAGGRRREASTTSRDGVKVSLACVYGGAGSPLRSRAILSQSKCP